MVSLEDVGYPQWLLAGLVVVLVLGTVWGGATSTAAFDAYNPAWDGAQDARELATETSAGTVIVRDAGRYGRLSSGETTALVLAPERRYDENGAGRIRGFVREGGTLVVAADAVDTAVANDLLASVEADSRVDGRLLRDPQRYSASPAMPLATTVNESRWTLGVSALALNYPSVVAPGNGSDVRVVVRSSEYGYLDENRNGSLDSAEELDQYPIVVVESVGNGRVIVVSDPSAFINSMLSRGDNRQFVRNLYGNETVAFDYSHTGNVPPLVEAVLVLRESALALLAFGGVLVLGAVALLRRGSWSTVRDWLGVGSIAADSGLDPALSTEAVVSLVEAEHPDWDEERVRQVARSITASRKGDGND